MKCVGIETRGKDLPLFKHCRGFDEWRKWVLQSSQDHIVAIHLQGVVDHILRNDIGPLSQYVRGVLFLKAQPFAGVGPERAQELMSATMGTAGLCVHVLSYAVPNVDRRKGERCPLQISQRFQVFQNAVGVLSPGAEIPWNLLEPPPWPEHLVAAYLALVAAERDPDIVRKVELPAETWDEASNQLREVSTAYLEAPVKWSFDAGGLEQNMARLTELRTILARVAEKQAL